MPRLFTALMVPPPIARELAALRGGLFGARWIDAENYHVTLRFVGDVDRQFARNFGVELGQIEREPLALSIDGLDCFGGDRPRAIVARVRADPALAALQAEHERAARRAGSPPEPRKYVPHVTLARLRGASHEAVADYLGARWFAKPLRFEAGDFALLSSRDSVGGGPYAVEARYALGRAGLTRHPLRRAL
ncbi:MAG: RNA 2',3'-cyclic phosphodiesterase [Hyphomicrobiales bacterium]|nr:RNA 2',3'-cyclic phosphodiesterase [Hyphomicrobiales bacterium]MDE2018041.1 RNA 2',3'-cyclic phosphodiesterase [Hyphomicrobiales bacterium]